MAERGAEDAQRGGLPYALGAYFLWGFLPLYMKLLHVLAPLAVLSHRILWSLPVVMAIMLARGQWTEFRAALSNRRAMLTMLASSTLISVNWLIYIYAIFDDHVLAASLGYYLNPLVNVLLGRLFLGERLTRLQGLAAAVAFAGVSILLFEARDTLWISLSLAVSFGLYGLVRKVAPLGSVPGLAMEVSLLSPLALAGAIHFASDPQGFGSSARMTSLLMGSGLATAIPLLLFATAARRMSYTALGFVQYLAPSIIFLLGAFVFHEPLDPARIACFGLIWSAVAIFSFDAFQRMRREAGR